MSRAKGGHAPYGWTTKEFGSDVPPGKRALATELQRLCRLLALNPDGSAPTQKQAADRLHVSDTSLSRYLSAEYLPDIGIVKKLHAIASTDAGSAEEAGVTLTSLEELHSSAAAEQCGSCVKLRGEASTLREKVEALEREIQAPKAPEADTVKTRSRRPVRAGQRSRLAARPDAALLPVPLRRGDRQQSNPEKRAVRAVARQAEVLQDGGRQGDALAVLRHSAEVLSPAETAALVCVLREGQLDELAGTLIHMYGRDNPDPHVMQAATQLHQHGAPDDAAALLQAALSTRHRTT